jgi:hypothetical protein
MTSLTNGTATDIVEGVVEARNERGVRVSGAWHNVSKYRPLALPDVGAQVKLGVDGKGFLTSVEVLQASDPSDQPTSSRDRQIARLSVLKSAAAFAATRSDIRSSDVLKIADNWIAWIEAQP